MKSLRGVNLGGWLVLERWMTPSLFAETDAVDEYTFMQTPDARVKIRDHQKNFIREEDFRWMAQHGVNAVRIPVGYWIFEGDAPYASCIGRLDWAFRMAEKYKLSVVISLHGAPGSQNGRDHSGRVGSAKWYKNKAHREATLASLVRLAKRYRDSQAFWGLELLNEPLFRPFNFLLRRFYRDSYRRLIEVAHPSTRIIFHDAFTPRLLSGVMRVAPHYAVAMDIHWYHFLNPLVKLLPLSWYFRWVVPAHRRLIRRLSRQQDIIVGEWSGVIAGETFRRYPNDQHEDLMREHIAHQLVAYQNACGWFYWSYKTESPGIWNFRSMVERSAIPSVE